MFKKILFIALFTILINSTIFSQRPPKKPIEWEEISTEDLNMKSCSFDEDAEALILCDYGETTLNDDLNLVFKRHLRIKIFNKDGFEWGTQSIRIYSHKRLEKVYDIEGITYFLGENGEIQSKELDDDDIFEEEIDDKHDKFTFTMPGLKAGCVVDIRYTIEAKNLYYIKDWNFQHEIPIKWSEYRVEMPENIAYVGVNRGYEKWEIKEIIQTKGYFSGTAASLIGNSNPKMNLYRWAIKDASAIKDVPYITTTADYNNIVELQLQGYVFSGNGVQKLDILGTWEKLNEELVDSDNFYERIDVTGDVEDITKDLINGISTKKEKMIEIYNWVKNSIVWDGKNRVYAQLGVDEVLEYRKGNSSEINFLLLAMLKYAGIDGYPVILSTRSNGEIQTLYPILNQFNYVISQVHIDGQKYNLDPTDPLRSYDLLPSEVLGVKGLVIRPGNKISEWVKLETSKKNISQTYITLKMNEMGDISGNVIESFSEFRSLAYRRQLQKKEEIEFVKEIFDAEEYGLQLDSIEITTKDSIHLPLIINLKFKSSVYAQKNGEYIYINPLVFHRRESNPFILKERKFPVDFNYSRSYNTLINFIIPDGFELLEKFKNKTVLLDNNLKFTRVATIQGNMIQILYRYDILSPIISPKNYEALKEFYSMIIDLQAEQFVLGKNKNKTEITKSSEG